MKNAPRKPSPKTILSRKARRLPVADRIELLDELWHSIAADQEGVPVPTWQKEMIRERLLEIRENQGKGLSLEAFEAKAQQFIDDANTRRSLKARK